MRQQSYLCKTSVINDWVPFAGADAKVINKVARKLYDEVPELVSTIEKKNQKFLGIGGMYSYDLVTTFPVNKASDLKGKRIAAGGLNQFWLEGTGAVPVTSSVNEAYSSLQTGVYEGWILFSGSVLSAKLYEVAPYVTKVGLGTFIGPAISMNKDKWDKLPPEVQKIFEEVGREFSDYMGEAMSKEYATTYDKLKAAGAKVSELSQEERVTWAKNIPNLHAPLGHKLS